MPARRDGTTIELDMEYLSYFTSIFSALLRGKVPNDYLLLCLSYICITHRDIQVQRAANNRKIKLIDRQLTSDSFSGAFREICAFASFAETN